MYGCYNVKKEVIEVFYFQNNIEKNANCLDILGHLRETKANKKRRE